MRIRLQLLVRTWLTMWSKRGYKLLLLLLFLPGIWPSIPTVFEPEALRLQYLKDIVERAINQRPPKTLLFLQRRQDFSCALKDVNSVRVATLRVDEFKAILIRKHFDSDVIAVACLSEIADSMLLTTLATSLSRIRRERIIIWLQCDQSELKTFKKIITQYATNNNFINLIVIHSTMNRLYGNLSIAAYRLNPFPKPKLKLFKDLSKGRFFGNFWRDFRNKTAIAIPSLFPPDSFWFIDKKTGKELLSGYTDRLILEFAKKRHIHLDIIENMGYVSDQKILRMTLDGEVDLSMHTRKWGSDLECTAAIDLSQLFVVVPCKQAMSIGDVFRGLRRNLLVFIGVYLTFSIVKTMVAAVSCQFLDCSYRFSYGNLFVNLNAFRGVLGLPIQLNRTHQSISMHQIIMVMSIFSVIWNCYFNANLSTLLTEHPKKQLITNAKELKESGIKVIFSSTYQEAIEQYIKNGNIDLHQDQVVFMENSERLQILFSLNNSYAYFMHTPMWRAVDSYQKHYPQKILCTTPGLVLVGIYPSYGIVNFNSVYGQALNDFIRWSMNMGLDRRWSLEAVTKFVEFRNPTHHQCQHSLMLSDLQWIWNTLGLGYTLSFVVFLGEIGKRYWQKRRQIEVVFAV